MSLITVRAKESADDEEVMRLRENYRASMFTFRGGEYSWNEKHVNVTTSEIETFVACINSSIVGYAFIRLMDSTCEILEIYVEKFARGVGVGDSLVDTVVKFAESHDVRYITADALPGDRDTKNLFERAGLISQRLLMRKDLNGRSI